MPAVSDLQAAVSALVAALGLASCSLSAAEKCVSNEQCAQAFGAGAVCGQDGFCRAPGTSPSPPDAGPLPPDAPRPPDAGGSDLALVDFCAGFVVPDLILPQGVNEQRFRVDTTGLTNRVSDLSACLDPGDPGAVWNGADGFFAVEMQAGEKWHFHANELSGADDPAMYVLDTCDERTCEVGDGADLCAVGSPEHLSFVPEVDGRYLIGIDSRLAGGAVLDLVVVRPVCGNDVLEHSESCDDGDTMPGDGCDELCRRELADGDDEVEANDDFTGTNRVLVQVEEQVEVNGQLRAPCDVDMFAIDVPQGGRVQAQIAARGGQQCVDGVSLGLVDLDGVTLLGSGGAGLDLCPTIDGDDGFAIGLESGTYFLRVELPRGQGDQLDYGLRIAVLD